MRISAAKIEMLLAERCMTKIALADASGVCRQSIRVILKRGAAEPKTVGKLAAGLGVHVSDIAEAVGPMEKAAPDGANIGDGNMGNKPTDNIARDGGAVNGLP